MRIIIAVAIGIISATLSIIAGPVQAVQSMESEHVLLTLNNIIIHLLPAVSAGTFAWAGARFTIKNHGERIERLERHNSWGRRKLEKLETVHLGRHPEDAPLLHIEQIEGKG